MNKTTLVLEALVTVRPVLAWKRAFKRPPAVPSATLRPVIELQPGYRSYTTPEQIRIAAEAFFENRCPVPAEQLLADGIYVNGKRLPSTVPAKPPAPVDAHLDLGGWWGV